MAEWVVIPTAAASPMSEAEQTSDSTAPPESSAQSRKSSGGGAIGVIAAFLALAAIAAAGYVWMEVQKLQALPGEIQAGTGKADRALADLDQRLDTLVARVADETEARIELQAAVSEDVAALADFSMQLEQVNERFASMTGTDRAQRNRFLQAEALYYLRIANARALLASDAGVAAEALQLADDKLRETGDPAFDSVRAQLSNDIAALKSLPSVDLAGVAFKLQSLETQAENWPLRNPAPERFTSDMPGFAAQNEAGEADAWSRFKATVADVFTSIVKVRENAEKPEVQLSNTEHALVIQSVRAELQLARLALVTGEFSLFEQSLAQVAAKVRAYFDLGDSAVMAAQETLTELAATQRPAAVPDISASLSQLLDVAGSDPQ